MRPSSLRRRDPAAVNELGADGPAGLGPPDEHVPLQSRWTFGPALLTRLTSVGLWTALITGPVALLLLVLTSGGGQAGATAPAPRPLDQTGQQAAASEFAARFAALWLTSARGQEEQLAGYVRTSQLELPERGAVVGAATIADIERVDATTWHVVVALTVTAPAPPASDSQPGPSAPAAQLVSSAAPTGPVLRYFAVPVHQDPTGLRALTLPAPVAAPVPATSAPRLDYRYPAALDDPLMQSLQQFAEALLTGAADLTRYTAPGTVLRPVQPPLFTEVRLNEADTDQELPGGGLVPADGTRLRVLATLTGTSAAGLRSSVQYPLSVAVRGGRWEVVGIDPAPVQSTAAPAVPPATNPAPPGAVPTVPASPASPATN